MPGERNINEAVENGRLPVLKTAFVSASRFRDALEPLGVRLGLEDPLGVADAKVIEAELKRLDINSRFARSAARAITGELRAGNYPRLFSVSSGVTIETGQVGEETFLMRSDLSDEAAHKRLGAYQLLLIAEAERLQNEKSQTEAEKTAEKNRPSSVVIKLISTYSPETYQTRVNNLTAEKTGRGEVQEIPHDVTGNTEILGRVIQRPDARKILHDGLEPEQFNKLLTAVRVGLIKTIDQDNTNARTAAQAILAFAEAGLKNSRKDIDMPIFIPKDGVDPLYYHLNDQSQNPNPKIEMEVEETRLGSISPFPRYLANLWIGRFDEVVLEDNLADIRRANPALGERIEVALLDENSSELFRDLRLGNGLKAEGGIVTVKELDKVLAPIIFSDLVVAQAVMADVIGEMYPMAYHPDFDGAAREMALFNIRSTAETFSLVQIRDVLAPRVIEKDVLRIQTLSNQISILEEQTKGLRGSDKQSNQRRQALEKQKTQLVKRLIGFKNQKDATIPIADNVNNALAQRMPFEAPKPKDYGSGEESLGYKRALVRFQALKDSKPSETPPDPDDFILEEESEGYLLDNSLLESYLTLIPEGWVSGRWRSGEPAERIKRGFAAMVVPAMIPEGVLDSLVYKDQNSEALSKLLPRDRHV